MVPSPAILEERNRSIEDADLEVLKEALLLSITRANDGIKQVTDIVRVMREFTHPSIKTLAQVELNRVIERTTAIC